MAKKIGLFEPDTHVQLVLGEDWSPPVYAEPPDEFWAALDSDDGLVYVEGSSSGSGEIAVPKVAALPEQARSVLAVAELLQKVGVCSFGGSTLGRPIPSRRLRRERCRC